MTQTGMCIMPIGLFIFVSAPRSRSCLRWRSVLAGFGLYCTTFCAAADRSVGLDSECRGALDRPSDRHVSRRHWSHAGFQLDPELVSIPNALRPFHPLSASGTRADTRPSAASSTPSSRTPPRASHRPQPSAPSSRASSPSSRPTCSTTSAGGGAARSSPSCPSWRSRHLWWYVECLPLRFSHCFAGAGTDVGRCSSMGSVSERGTSSRTESELSSVTSSCGADVRPFQVSR